MKITVASDGAHDTLLSISRIAANINSASAFTKKFVSWDGVVAEVTGMHTPEEIVNRWHLTKSRQV